MVTPPSPQLRNICFAGDQATGAELRAAVSALGDALNMGSVPIHQISSLSWEDALKQAATLMIFPETSSWARSRHRSVQGPQPVRSAEWPWGFPWLSPRERDQVDVANKDLRQAFYWMNHCVNNHPATHLLLIHPEDLGISEQGRPASIWQLPELREWANRWGLRRYGTHQCVFGRSSWPYPVGILSTHPLPHSLFSPGWPIIDSASGLYQGPIARSCSCPPGSHQRDSDFRDRRLRSKDVSFLQPGVQDFLATLALHSAAPTHGATDLWSKGSDVGVIRSASCLDEGDTTDEELAATDVDRAFLPESLDILSVRALGLSDLDNFLTDLRKQESLTGMDGRGKSKGALGQKGVTDTGIHPGEAVTNDRIGDHQSHSRNQKLPGDHIQKAPFQKKYEHG